MNESDALEAACRAYIGTRQDGTHPWDDEATRNDTFARHLRVGMARALAAARNVAPYRMRDTSMPFDPEPMARAKALRAKATAGPWYVQLSYGTGPDDHDGEPYCQWEIYSAGVVDDPCVLSGAGDLDVEGNARFIAAAPELVDGLIGEVERLRGEGERLKTRMRAEGLHVPGDGHSVYADPIRGGFDGYQAACWDCDWRSPTIHNDKGIAQDEARAHWEQTDD